jgi:hypothetical protein
MTARKSAGNSPKRGLGKPFEPGNPGKPKGARHKATLAAEALLEGEAKALTRKAIAMALAGDTTALRLCLERLVPPRKERTIRFAAPALAAAADVPAALAAIVAAIAQGYITPGEGSDLAALIDRFRAAFEVESLEARITALESHHESD